MPCKNKLDASNLFFAYFLRGLGFLGEEPFLTYGQNHNVNLLVFIFIPSKGPSIAHEHITNAGTTDTPKATYYTVQAVCQL